MKNLQSIIFFAIIAIILVAWLTTCKSCQGTGNTGNADSIFYWRNKAGGAVASLKALQDEFGNMQQFYIDSIAKVYKTKTKFVRSLVVATTEAEAEIKPDGPTEKEYYPVTITGCPPAVKNMKQHFSNAYYDASVQTGDSSYMRLKAFDTITVLWKRVKEGNIFNRRNYTQLDFSTANPYVKITGLRAYRVPDPKPKKWGLGLQLGYGFSFINNKLTPTPYAGIGLSRSIIRF